MQEVGIVGGGQCSGATRWRSRGPIGEATGEAVDAAAVPRRTTGLWARRGRVSVAAADDGDAELAGRGPRACPLPVPHTSGRAY